MDNNWFSFLPTLIATFLGVGLAFLLNHFYNNYLERKRARKLLFLLKEEVKRNLDILLELEKEFRNPTYTPFYNLTFVAWNSVISNITPILKKLNIIKDVFWFYYELQHLERKINKIFELTYNLNLTKEGLDRRNELIGSLNLHIPEILMGKKGKSPQTIIVEIECLMNKLR